MRNVLGQLNPDSFTRVQLLPLSRQAVEKLAGEKGYNGEDVFSISGGNPFYVNEILASYSPGIPDNIKDSILSVYNRQDEKTKRIWEILSILPTGLESKFLQKTEPDYAPAIEKSLDSKILILKEGRLSFKHELYRRTLEASLSPLVRVALNRRILVVLREHFDEHQETERIIHHAKNANEYDIVVQFAPIAARQAASVGAHTEASRLYLSAIEYYQGDEKDLLIQLYESYAYECYLTNQIREAIIYIGRSLNLWKQKNDVGQIGNCLRFLSRLWWYDGNRKNAESYASQAIEMLDPQPSSRAKAMAYSNMSQLKMLSDEAADCLFWGEKAIVIARELDDKETLSHAMNNIGTVQTHRPSTMEKGLAILRESLAIALENGYHEHVARAYTNLGFSSVTSRNYAAAAASLDAGIRYCEERDLDSWSAYMLSVKARLKLETGCWKEAENIADILLKNEHQSSVIRIGALAVAATLRIRRGDPDALPLLLEAKTRAFQARELQRIVPALSALLEYEWITGQRCIEEELLNRAIGMTGHSENAWENHEFAFWLAKARCRSLPLSPENAPGAWDHCPYERALILFEGDDDDKRRAIGIVQGMGAQAVYEKMKLEMRSSGIKSIPRGIRKTTQANPALLTDRELEVLFCLHKGMQNEEIAGRLFISAKTVDHHISSILYKLESKSRVKAVQEAVRMGIIK
jgi:DNA-binding CsgD family transcriptional regulator/tetratricopeptide (TPR) repeat protein